MNILERNTLEWRQYFTKLRKKLRQILDKEIYLGYHHLQFPSSLLSKYNFSHNLNFHDFIIYELIY